MSRRPIARGDIMLIVAGIVVAALLWAAFELVRDSGPGRVVVVNVVGVDVERIALAGGERSSRTVRGQIGRSTFEIVNGRVRMVSSDCPDKTCIKMGWASQPGQVIVCLPNRVVLKVESQ